MDIIFLAFCFWLAFGVACAVIAANKGRSAFMWLLLGILFGPFALVVIACLSRDAARDLRAGLQSGKMRRCPYCAETIRTEAIKCRHCGEDLPPAPQYDFLGSGLVDHSQKMTVAASATAEKKAVGQRS